MSDEFGTIHKDLRTGILTPGCCVDDACQPHTCMTLPAGKTCADCIHVERCVAMFGVKPENVICDFYPRRYQTTCPKCGVPVIPETEHIKARCPTGHWPEVEDLARAQRDAEARIAYEMSLQPKDQE